MYTCRSVYVLLAAASKIAWLNFVPVWRILKLLYVNMSILLLIYFSFYLYWLIHLVF